MTNHVLQGDGSAKGLLPFIEHQVGEVSISQRAYDGYINATALCKAAGKQINHYLELQSTHEFIKELSSDLGLPRSELIQIKKGGIPKEQGTWVHPQVAIHLAQWASPKFAVLVSKWVFEWLSGNNATRYEIPYHIRRYLVNRSKIPNTHFSMLHQMTLKLLAPLEEHGYIISKELMPDISLGRMFVKWLKDNEYDPETFPTYTHRFDDGKRPPVEAKLYPNELMTAFNEELGNWITNGKALKYFKERDLNAIPALEKTIEEIKLLEQATN